MACLGASIPLGTSVRHSVGKVARRPGTETGCSGISLAAQWGAIRLCAFGEQDHFAGSFRLAIRSPCRHQLAPLLKQIAAPVCRFGLVLYRVGKGHLANLMREGRCLTSPISESAAEAVNGCGVRAHSAEML